jgi:hypothetical protein
LTPAPLAVLSQILALVFGSLAMMWGFFCVYLAAYPGPCGDDPGPGLGVLESWVLDVPAGLLMFATGWFVKKGSPRMRNICIIISLVTLCLPALATWLLDRRHCP